MATPAPAPRKSESTGPTSGADSSTEISANSLAAAGGRIWKSLLAYLPSPDSSLLSKIFNLVRHQRGTGIGGAPYPVKSRRRKGHLPLPVYSSDLHFARISETSGALIILEDVSENILSHLHNIGKSLAFWQSRSEGTNSQKIYFMFFERGPKAFVEETTQLIRRVSNDGSSIQFLSQSASDMISTKFSVLTTLQHCLATFLAEVYLETNRQRGVLAEESENSFSTAFSILSNLFSKLESSICHPREVYKREHLSSLNDGSSWALVFKKLPEVDLACSQWTDTTIRDATNLTYENLQRLDSYISFILSSYQRPSKMNLYWVHYTCGAVGLSVCTLWLLRHSSVVGSPDIENWIRDAKESTLGFWEEHVENPLISIRDELFETFKRRHKGVMEVEEVQLTSNSLRRMLLAFCEDTKASAPRESMSDAQMLEIVMSRYEKEVVHPLQNLLSGELARAMLIQIQKLKLDVETAMLELDQILKANEINFAILAALPAFFVSLLLLMLFRAWISQDTRAEGRGKVARRQRRLLLVEVEKRFMDFRTCMEKGKEEEARCQFGLMLYSLDRLYKAVERHAKEAGEWPSLREEIMELANPEEEASKKLAVISRMGRMYECLRPYVKSR